ncbi:geranylgeranyl diphosphate synthase [Purpureocillium lilacinum]|uniref:Geranylgeranyl diphosphate synthase n=1 Tax=Purpureocillium lilacinum TaxID=33203 RepID=A0A179G9X4_PURLI|nr:geranylgeranyl diphosphate synthase [Purpureocillium lilacinum]KAK4089657.1 hypothetical protein Purlil1_5760 [Purpureocillium lilacinum]OAQ74616.1 geranylgeranyl diphosphate synthase [Purpureocillium lilacinum]OAQ82719.1 geranylgeranyl diphosphate synthase [Purpureocillium lilacinum]PWI75385.1 hypothetical protein PCL_06043 [Purpureocillium lilacinum]GJN70937.1 terpene cyclase [Purpureocillium lilacinum]
MSSPPLAAAEPPYSSSPGTAGNAAALTSPNAIPPRTSSTGLHHQHINRASLNAVQQGHAGFTQPTPLPASVLAPVSEADWIGQRGKKPHHQAPPGTDWRSPALCLSPGLDTMGSKSDSSGAASPYQGPGAAERYAWDDLNFTPKRCWTQEKEAVIRAPFDYALSHPGKSFRAQLVAAFNAMLDVPAPSLEVITRVIGMLHEASLLIDDVQDSSELRRGFPVAHNIFGVPQTINSANYMCYVGLQELQRLENPRAVSIFAEELVNLHRGQGMDLYWRDTLTCPTEDDYLEMVGNKTGGLFRLGIKLMQAESSADVDCVPLVNLIGLIYQIRDDYLNLASKEYTENKGMCEDLTEGKFSFPVIHSIRSAPANMQLVNILKQKTSDVQIKRYAVSYMEGTGSFAYTRAVIATLIQRARKLAVQMDAGKGRSAGILKILDKMEIID